MTSFDLPSLKDDTRSCFLAVGEPVFQRSSQLHEQKWRFPCDKQVSHLLQLCKHRNKH